MRETRLVYQNTDLLRVESIKTFSQNFSSNINVYNIEIHILQYLILDDDIGSKGT